MEKMLALLLGFSFLTGCQSMRPQTLGELSSGYTYIPVDPFSVQTVPGDSCKREELHSNFPVEKGFLLDGKPVYREIMGSLPDNSVRMLVEQFDSKGNVSYGAGKVGGKAESYRVTVDYINADTVNQEFWISKTMLTREGKRVEVPLAELPSFFRYASGSEQYRVSRTDPGIVATLNIMSRFMLVSGCALLLMFVFWSPRQTSLVLVLSVQRRRINA
ncbi:hypothetical protein THH46_00510 [Pseudomonas sp. NA13]